MTPFDFYQKQLQKAIAQEQALTQSVKRISLSRVFLAVGILVLLYFSFAAGGVFIISGTVFLVALFLLLVNLQNRKEKALKLETIRRAIFEKELNALNQDYRGFKNGSEFIQHNHPYS